MTRSVIASVLMLLLTLLLPTILSAKNGESILGQYTTLGRSDRIITLHLKEQGEADLEIEDRQDGQKGVVTAYSALWSYDGESLQLEYNKKTELLNYNESLPLSRSGGDIGIPGLQAPGSVQNTGIIGHAPLWDAEALAHLPLLTKYKLKLRGFKLSEDDYDMPLLAVLSPGIILFVIGLLLTIQKWLFVVRARETIGEVVSITAHFPFFFTNEFFRHSPKRYLPKILYMDEMEKPHSFVGGYGSSLLLSNEVGKKVAVLYNPTKPERACIKNAVLIFGPSMLFVALGILTILPFLLI